MDSLNAVLLFPDFSYTRSSSLFRQQTWNGSKVTTVCTSTGSVLIYYCSSFKMLVARANIRVSLVSLTQEKLI